jgi:hypothetical protein
MFDRIFRILLIILPWSVLFTVFFSNKLGIPGVSFFKEGLLLVLMAFLIWDFFKKKIFPKFDILDYLIASYIGYLVVITLLNGL